ncbi:hypothetical protein DP939_22270 [Spongiactinospora rosea]|uniref:Uncharacterized protein n=2 Tax=Spongiactinospora rosea TaxID=2248750 RepID=A0A366LXL2_9ACTN|nr:hypothetical protein DP939_22270 [Spongiactinospora rosea]
MLRSAADHLKEETMIGALTIDNCEDGAKLRLMIDRSMLPYFSMADVEGSDTAYLMIDQSEAIKLLQRS